MRIRRLDLVRYGKFTNRTVEFPRSNPDLHIVVGSNEAGKSTVLAAVEDFLFGIDNKSPFNFLHKYSEMRVGAVLEANGETFEAFRRKGRDNTLLGADQNPLPSGEGTIAPFLSGIGRQAFERIQSLDHERLRTGGQAVLEEDDSADESLFSAGTGVQGVGKRIAGLEGEADKLWGARRSKDRRYYQEFDRLKEAQKEISERSVSAREWSKLKDELENRQGHYDRLATEIEEQDSQLRKLARIRRVAPRVREKKDLDRVIAELSESAAEGATWVQALRQRSEDIDRLDERRIQMKDMRSDLPERERELEATEQELRGIATEFGWTEQDSKSLAARIPAPPGVALVRSQFQERGAVLEAVRQAQAALAEAEASLNDANAQRIEQAARAAGISELKAVVNATALESGDIGSRIRGARAESEATEEELRQTFEFLNPQPPSIEQAGAIQVPATATVEEHRNLLTEINQDQRSAMERLARAEAKLTADETVRDQITAEEQPVTQEHVQELRDSRDNRWSQIRQRISASDPVPEADIEGFEGALRKADDASDRRVETAEAGARLAEIQRSITKTRGDIEAAREEQRTLEERSDTLARRWETLWSRAPVTALDPTTMLAWLARLGNLRELIARQARARALFEALRKEETAAIEQVGNALRALGIEGIPEAASGLGVTLEFAKTACQAHERSESERLRCEREVNKQRTALSQAESRSAEWSERWSEAVGRLGLDSDADPDLIGKQLERIEEMRRIADKIHDLREHRIAEIRREIGHFEDEVAELTQRLAADLAAADPDDAVIELKSRLRTVSRHAELLATLQAEGDGLDVAALEAECESIDPDQAGAREQTLENERDQLREEQLEAVQQLNAAKSEFNAVGGSDAAAVAESKRQDVLAKIREIAEHYVRLRVAALVFRWAVERHRREQQGPLLGRAGEIFAEVTNGSFQALELDYGEDDKPRIVGLRPDQERVGVTGMSDGTVDQLYLSLRIASIESRVEHSSPLPFVADDLFINFDDERAASGLRALSRLAGRCQVLFFTHHERLVEIARSEIGLPSDHVHRL